MRAERITPSGDNCYILTETKTQNIFKQIEAIEPETNIAPLQAEISFDWLTLDQSHREENIEKYKNLLFENNSSHIYFSKEDFKKEFVGA